MLSQEFLSQGFYSFDQILLLTADPCISYHLGCEYSVSWFCRNVAGKVWVVYNFELERISFVIGLHLNAAIYNLLFKVQESCLIIPFIFLIQFE